MESNGGISEFRRARRATVLFIQALLVLLVFIAFSVYWEKLPELYSRFRIQNSVSMLLESDNLILYSTILTLSIGYIGYLLYQTSLSPEAVHQGTKKERIVTAMAKSIYAGTAPLFLFYSAVVFNDSLIIAFLIGVVIMGISGLPQTKIGSYEYYFILSAVLFLLVIILLWCLNLNEVTAFIELVSLLSLIVTTASIEEAGKLYYLLDYETAIEYLNEGQNQLVTKLLSPRVAIINIIIALVFMYHLNFHLISFSYLVLSVPIITRTIKLLSFNPEQYWNIELEDKTIEGVFVYSKPSRGDYITVLSEDGRKRISKGSIVAMHPAETSSE